jgi:hypothetical protein
VRAATTTPAGCSKARQIIGAGAGRWLQARLHRPDEPRYNSDRSARRG